MTKFKVRLLTVQLPLVTNLTDLGIQIILANPEQELTVWNFFFVHHKDFKVYLDLA
jgi:hypothetical protein